MISKYFQFDAYGTDYKTEIVAGITTFLSMSYIIIVNPKILEAAGIPFGPSFTATILTAFFGTITMGLYAKRPFAIAPYMGENAFIAYTVVGVLGYSWQTAIGAIFISGVLFTIITLLNIRSWLANAVPKSLKIAFAIGIGLFLTFIGLNDTGIVTLGVKGAPVHIGNLTNTTVILSIVGFITIGILILRKVNAAILIGIIVTTLLGIILGETELPKAIVSAPPSLSETFLALDIPGALTWGFFAVILTVLVMDFIDTMGTLIGMSYKAKLLDENGNLPEIEKPFLADALSTVIASLLGTTTAGVYIESATGIEAGGKTGFTAVVTAILFLVALIFSPILTIIPAYAYGGALIIVGMLMFGPIKEINFEDLSEVIPAFATIALMSFSFNIGIGMTAGFVLYPLVKIFAGKKDEINGGMWVLYALSVLFYIFYPY